MRSIFLSAATCVALIVMAGSCSRGARYDEHLEDGLEALAAGQHQDAIDALDKAVRLRPDSATAYCNLGIAHAAIDQTEEAIFTLLMAKDLQKQDPRPAILLADVYSKAGRGDEARKTLATLNENVPGQPNILTHMATVEYREGNADRARLLLDDALDIKKDYAPALYNMAVIKRDHDADAIGALRFFARYLSVAGDGPYTERAREASALLRRIPPRTTARTPSASPAPRRRAPVASATPSSPTSLADRARKAIEEQDYEEALVLLKEATSTNAEDADALWELAALYRDQLEQKDRAVATFRAFAESFPSDDRAERARREAGIERVNRVPVTPSSERDRRATKRRIWQEALEAHREKDWDQAAALYEQVLKLDNRLGIAAYNLGLVYKAKGDLIAARDAFAGAVEKSPAMVKAQYMQAVVEREMGETDQSIASAQQVIKEDPTHDKAHLLVGLLYRQKEQYDRAQVHFEKALELAPNAEARDQAQALVSSNAKRLP